MRNETKNFETTIPMSGRKKYPKQDTAGKKLFILNIVFLFQKFSDTMPSFVFFVTEFPEIKKFPQKSANFSLL